MSELISEPSQLETQPEPESAVAFDADGDVFMSSPFWAVYDGLCHDGYSHNVALWAAWECIPDKHLRQRSGLPSTQKEFAEAILGVRPRTLRGYRTRYPELVRLAQRWMLNSILGKYRHSVYTALGQSASMVEGKHSASDRRLFVQLTGDLDDTAVDTAETEASPLPDALEAALARAFGEDDK